MERLEIFVVFQKSLLWLFKSAGTSVHVGMHLYWLRSVALLKMSYSSLQHIVAFPHLTVLLKTPVLPYDTAEHLKPLTHSLLDCFSDCSKSTYSFLGDRRQALLKGKYVDFCPVFPGHWGSRLPRGECQRPQWPDCGMSMLLSQAKLWQFSDSY